MEREEQGIYNHKPIMQTKISQDCINNNPSGVSWTSIGKMCIRRENYNRMTDDIKETSVMKNVENIKLPKYVHEKPK
jgi:hypothetical protein